MRNPDQLDLSKSLKYNFSLDLFNFLQMKSTGLPISFGKSHQDVCLGLGHQLKIGNFTMVKHFVEKCAEQYGQQFNTLHKNAILQGADVQKIKNIKKQSLMKKALDSLQLTPMHIAAVNPDPAVFKLYFKANPTSLVFDVEQRDLVHYAVVNHNSEVLRLLVQKRVELNNRDVEGFTPLMLACRLGRVEAVQLLLEEQKRIIEALDAEDEDYAHNKVHSNFTRTEGPYKNTPLHYASMKGHLQVVKALIEEGDADIDAKNFYQNTPLGVSCEQGHIKVVDYLLEKGAKPHGVDKKGRSPLIKAVINGHLHVVSHLLRFGVNPNYHDTSGNSALHYACGYGWMDIVKYLIEAGANINSMNEWKMYPVLLAMLKGHFGIVDYMINLKDLNATFQDDQGRTLISQLCMSINEDSASNLQFLLDKGKIDVTIKDQQGFTPLHHLANNDLSAQAFSQVREKKVKPKMRVRYIIRKGKKIKLKDRSKRYNRYNRQQPFIRNYIENEDQRKEYEQILSGLESVSVKCAEMLVKAGLTFNEKSERLDATPLFLAVWNKNSLLSEYLAAQEPKAISGFLDNSKMNILHVMTEDFYHFDRSLLDILVRWNRNELREMAQQRDTDGFTPYQAYFKQVTSLIENIKAFANLDNKRQECMAKTVLPRMLSGLREATRIYAEELLYDITEQVGVPQERINKLDILLRNELIGKDTYEAIMQLRYEEPEEDEKMLNEEERDYSNDDITKFDKNKENMSIAQIKFKSFSDSQNKPYDWEKMRKRTKYQYIQNTTSDYKINIEDFYGDKNTLKTTLMLLLSLVSFLPQQHEEHFLPLIKQMLTSSHPKDNNEPPHRQGFNKFKKSNNPAILALKYERYEVLKTICQSLDLNAQSQVKRKLGFLHYLSKVKNKQVVDTVLQNKGLNLKIKDRKDNVPLHYAAFYRNEYLVQRFLEFGCNPNQQNKYGYTPLHMSLFAYDESQDHTPKIERMLLKAGADLNIEDEDGRTPFFMLFFKQKKSLADKTTEDPANLAITLINEGKINDINHQDKNGFTVLHYACMRGSTIAALTLINNGADIRIKSYLETTPFGEALLNKRTNLCIFLVQNGCDLLEPVKVWTPPSENKTYTEAFQLVLPQSVYDDLTTIQKKHYPSHRDYLRESYTKPSEQSPFYLSLQQNENGLCYLLLSKNTPLFQVLVDCLKLSKFEKFVDLLENTNQKIDPKQKDQKHNRTLLHILVRELDLTKDKERALEIIEFLIDTHKLDPLQSDSKGKNILHLACGSFTKFQVIYEYMKATIKPQQLQSLMSQKDKKHQAIPLVKLFLNKQILITEQLIELLKTIAIKNMDLTYKCTVKQLFKGNDAFVRFIMPGSKLFDEVPEKPFKSHLSFRLIELICNQTNYPDKAKAIVQNIRKLSEIIDLDQRQDHTKRTVLMECVLINQENAIKALLGYDWEDGKILKRHKPIVDINAVDAKGNNALMLAIQPGLIHSDGQFGKELDKVTLQNLRIIQILLEAGADHQKAAILSKKNYALTNFIQEYLNPQKRPELFETPQLAIEINGAFQQPVFEGAPYEDDAEKYLQGILQRISQNNMEQDDEESFGPDKIGKFVNCELVLDNTTGRLFDAAMTKVDVKKQLYGVYNFYVIQLIRDKLKGIYILWTRWGRIIEIGQYQRTPFQTLEEAIKEFKKVYKQKVGASWEEFDQYIPVPLKYTVRRIGGKVIFHRKKDKKWEISARHFLQGKQLILNFDEHKLVKSNLTEQESNFIRPLVNQAAEFRKLRKVEIDPEVFINVLIDHDLAKELREILYEIKLLLDKQNQARDQKNFDLFQQCELEIFEKSNQYYEIVQPKIFKDHRLQSINNHGTLFNEINKLYTMYDLEHVTKLLYAACFRLKELNPYDYCFQHLNVKLIPLGFNDLDFNLIMRYVNQTFNQNKPGYNDDHKWTVHNIFGLERKNNQVDVHQRDQDQEFANIHNHYMLFHGTRNANVLSVMEQGLRITPSNSIVQHGSTFGEGVYLADMASVSFSYTDFSGRDDCFMFVVEAALGNVLNCINHNIFQGNSKLPRGYQSLRMMSSQGPDFNQSLVKENGQIWPVGPVIQYETPYFEYKDQEYKDYRSYFTTLDEEAKKPKDQGKNIPQKKEKAKQKKNSVALDDDVVMIDTTVEKTREEEKKKADDEYDRDKELKPEKTPTKRLYDLVPNKVEYHRFINSWDRYQGVNYYAAQTEYVIFNPNQLRVRYVIHFKAKHK